MRGDGEVNQKIAGFSLSIGFDGTQHHTLKKLVAEIRADDAARIAELEHERDEARTARLRAADQMVQEAHELLEAERDAHERTTALLHETEQRLDDAAHERDEARAFYADALRGLATIQAQLATARGALEAVTDVDMRQSDYGALCEAKRIAYAALDGAA